MDTKTILKALIMGLVHQLMQGKDGQAVLKAVQAIEAALASA